MNKILIVYATTDGHTLKICERLQQVIELPGTVSDWFGESLSTRRRLQEENDSLHYRGDFNGNIRIDHG